MQFPREQYQNYCRVFQQRCWHQQLGRAPFWENSKSYSAGTQVGKQKQKYQVNFRNFINENAFRENLQFQNYTIQLFLIFKISSLNIQAIKFDTLKIFLQQFDQSITLMQIPLFEANQNYEEHHYGKVDICFYNSLKRLQKTYRLFKQFSIVRACLIAMVLLSHFQDDETKNIYPQTYKLVTLLLYILLIFNLGGWKLGSWTLENYFLDNNVMYSIASRIGHSEESQLLNDQFIYNQNNHIFDTIPLKVSSTVYQYKLNMLSTDIDDVYRQFSQKQCTSLICEQIKRDTYINFWQNVLNLVSLSIFVISYIVLRKDTGVGSLEHTLILVHLLSEIYIRSTVYLIVLVVVLSPLFCLWVCIYSTFFKKKGIVVLPQVQQATTQMIIQCQGKCPICYQNIIQKQKVIALKCSSKHVFHQICIQGWTKVKANCPICRKQLEMI